MLWERFFQASYFSQFLFDHYLYSDKIQHYLHFQTQTTLQPENIIFLQLPMRKANEFLVNYNGLFRQPTSRSDTVFCKLITSVRVVSHVPRRPTRVVVLWTVARTSTAARYHSGSCPSALLLVSYTWFAFLMFVELISWLLNKVFHI